MFFDINKIHIQVGVLFNNGKCIVINSSSSQNIIYKIYTQNIYKNDIQQIKSKKVRVYLSKKIENFGCQTWKDNIFPGCSHILSNIF